MKKEKTWFQAWMDAVRKAQGQMKLVVLIFGWFPALLAEDAPSSKEEDKKND